MLTTDVGVGWDAVRIPIARGLGLHRRLCQRPETYGRLGPVVASQRSDATYWLITTGSLPGDWPSGCRLLTSGSAIVLPHYSIPATWSRWLNQPTEPGHLTGAVWLAAALNDQLALEASR